MGNRDFQRKLSVLEANQLIRQFKAHLKCWKVSLQHGDILNFELGRRVWEPWSDSRKGGSLVGSACLTLKGSNWIIFEQGIPLYNFADVTRELADNEIMDAFLAKTLSSVDIIHPVNLIFLFEGGPTVEMKMKQKNQLEVNLDLFNLFLPDKTVITCDNGGVLRISNSDVPIARDE